VLSHPPYSPDLAPVVFLFSELKICDERDEIRGCLIDPTDCDERCRKERVLRHSIRYMSDVNVVSKRAGTILSEGINKYFLSFLCGFCDLRSGT
jgi:hypothetical protein